MDSTPSDHIFNSFPSSTKEDWLTAAILELAGADPIQKLSSEKGNLKNLPYYDRQDAAALRNFQLKPSSGGFLGARGWYNMPLLVVTNESESNQKVLSELNSGADGIILTINNPTTDVFTLLDKIEWPYCAISFIGNISGSFINRINTYVAEKAYDETTLVGCVFGYNPIALQIGSLKLFENWVNFHPLGVTIDKIETPAEEIATAFALAVKQIDFFTNKGLSLKQAIAAHAFKINLTEDFFLNIAKLKAVRILWNNVVRSFDDQNYAPLFIHAFSTVWLKKEYQPNGNMLAGTTAAMSAILGGCDALTIMPEENNNVMMERVARNISSVLREESHLSKVADPTAGSYYLESLINQLCDQAWQLFQKQMTL